MEPDGGALTGRRGHSGALVQSIPDCMAQVFIVALASWSRALTGGRTKVEITVRLFTNRLNHTVLGLPGQATIIIQVMARLN